MKTNNPAMDKAIRAIQDSFKKPEAPATDEMLIQLEQLYYLAADAYRNTERVYQLAHAAKLAAHKSVVELEYRIARKKEELGIDEQDEHESNPGVGA